MRQASTRRRGESHVAPPQVGRSRTRRHHRLRRRTHDGAPECTGHFAGSGRRGPVPRHLVRIHRRSAHSHAGQAAGGRGEVGTDRRGLGLVPGSGPRHLQPVVRRPGRSGRGSGPGARDQRPAHALDDAWLGKRRCRHDCSAGECLRLRESRRLGGRPLQGPCGRLGGLERAQPIRLLEGHGRPVRRPLEGRLPGDQGRRSFRTGRARGPFGERHQLAVGRLRRRDGRLLRRDGHPPLHGHGGRAARDAGRRLDLDDLTRLRRPRPHDPVRRRFEADLVHRVRLVVTCQLGRDRELEPRSHLAAAGRLLRAHDQVRPGQLSVRDQPLLVRVA